MKRAVKVIAALIVLTGVFIAGVTYDHWHESKPGTNVVEAKGYHCPMHPNVRSDRPGDCPICGMKLVPDTPVETPAAAANRKVLFYRDPHQHEYKSDKPGVNPETGSDLEPVYEDDPQGMPQGTFRIAPEKQQLIGVQFGTADYESTERAIRAVGRVAADETRISRVQTRIEGWIQDVFVNFTGQLVKQGTPLLTIYSPELLATQQEYLLALRSRDVLSNSPLQTARESSGGLIEAARRRLQLWDLSDQQIAQIEKTGKPLTNVTLHAPASGYITERNAFPQQRITPETQLYTIVDLSRVWVMADVFEADLSAIRMGAPASVTAAAYPGRRWPGKISYVQPQVDPATRTMRVRVELNNPEMLLKPDMFVNVDLTTGGSQRLMVPVNAVLNSGTRQTVFVDRGNGYLEPRQVQIGSQSGDRVEILSGLKPGERIVTAGTFLIDSESQLKAAASGGSSHQHD